MAAISTRDDDPIVGRQVIAREGGAACDLDEDWSMTFGCEPPVDREILSVDDGVWLVLNGDDAHAIPPVGAPVLGVPRANDAEPCTCAHTIDRDGAAAT
jgi:hypothetical protein